MGRIVTAGDFAEMQEFGSYNFYRLGITPDGQFVTPKSNSVLPSVTNNSLQQLAKDMGMKVQQRLYCSCRKPSSAPHSEGDMRAALELGEPSEAVWLTVRPVFARCPGSSLASRREISPGSGSQSTAPSTAFRIRIQTSNISGY